jgi:hypothetical protein
MNSVWINVHNYTLMNLDNVNHVIKSYVKIVLKMNLNVLLVEL